MSSCYFAFDFGCWKEWLSEIKQKKDAYEFFRKQMQANDWRAELLQTPSPSLICTQSAAIIGDEGQAANMPIFRSIIPQNWTSVSLSVRNIHIPFSSTVLSLHNKIFSAANRPWCEKSPNAMICRSGRPSGWNAQLTKVRRWSQNMSIFSTGLEARARALLVAWIS